MSTRTMPLSKSDWVEYTLTVKADRLHIAHGLVGGALHINLAPARQQALDRDDAERPPCRDHEHVAQE